MSSLHIEKSATGANNKTDLVFWYASHLCSIDVGGQSERMLYVIILHNDRYVLFL